MLINRKISIHLQDFPDVNFLPDEQDLVANMDFVRSVCSTALSIRDNKNLRVRLPLNQLKVIGKNAARINDFKDIIADEVNVKNILIEEKIEGIAELKLQINFKKIGAKYGPKIKEITEAAKKGEFKKIAENKIEIASIILEEDEFEIKLASTNQNDKKFVIMALPSNDCLVALDVEITKDLEEEGIARDIVRAVQQSRKDANLNVSNRIALKIFSSNHKILQVVEKFSSYIKEQVLAVDLAVEYDSKKIHNSSKLCFASKIDDGDLTIGLDCVG